MKPEPLKLPPDHNPSTCKECLAATRDTLRFVARLECLCRCCGTHVQPGETIYVVTNPSDPNDSNLPLGQWRMCGRCWCAGYQRGETVDSINGSQRR